MRMIWAAIVMLSATPTLASEIERVAPVTNDAAKKECGACHMAYQPELLPAESWRQLFAGLGDHFGEDASLADAKRQEILDYYVANAGPDDGAKPAMRITERPWWQGEHRRIKESRWKDAAIKFKGNCGACHKQAEQGEYEEE